MEIAGDGAEAVCAARQTGRSHAPGPALALAQSTDLLGIRGDDDLVELGAAAGGFDDPREHGPAGNLAQYFARQAGGLEPRGNDADHALRLFPADAWIKYHYPCCALAASFSANGLPWLSPATLQPAV